jgi:hypothetical protein
MSATESASAPSKPAGNTGGKPTKWKVASGDGTPLKKVHHIELLNLLDHLWKNDESKVEKLAEQIKTQFNTKFLPDWHCLIAKRDLFVDIRFRKGMALIASGPLTVMLFKSAPPAPGTLTPTAPDSKPANEEDSGSGGGARERKPRLKVLFSKTSPATEKWAGEAVTASMGKDLPVADALREIKEKMNCKFGSMWHVGTCQMENNVMASSVGYDGDNFIDMICGKHRVVLFRHSQEAPAAAAFDAKGLAFFLYIFAAILFMLYYNSKVRGTVWRCFGCCVGAEQTAGGRTRLCTRSLTCLMLANIHLLPLCVNVHASCRVRARASSLGTRRCTACRCCITLVAARSPSSQSRRLRASPPNCARSRQQNAPGSG